MEYIPDSPSVARLYCPECEPDADPSSEILDVRWCTGHAPSYAGRDDLVITVETFLSGSIEAGGDVNRRWCDLLHRRDAEPVQMAIASAA
jgi:hypothetical protein